MLLFLGGKGYTFLKNLVNFFGFISIPLTGVIGVYYTSNKCQEDTTENKAVEPLTSLQRDGQSKEDKKIQ